MNDKVQLFTGDCLDVLKTLPDNSFDSIVTDPPYGLSFMGKKWDYDVPSQAIWEECLRVLKPGGHLLSFAGSRTYHRMVVRIEDAGFEIRDQMMWLYGSGFPKSQNVGKAMVSLRGTDAYPEPTGKEEEWDGMGTALKPAHEPIVMARKPFKGTLAKNVLAHGTGALNIDACRVPFAGTADEQETKGKNSLAKFETDSPVTKNSYGHYDRLQKDYDAPGRWPANVMHDGSECVTGQFPSSSTTGKRKASERVQEESGATPFKHGKNAPEYTDAGSAARFFYCAKPSPAERHRGCVNPGPQFTHGVTLRQVENAATSGNNHPTVKPVKLMVHLITLITPACGRVLDPFTGSGSTGVGAVEAGFAFTGIEREAHYMDITRARIGYALQEAECTSN